MRPGTLAHTASAISFAALLTLSGCGGGGGDREPTMPRPEPLPIPDLMPGAGLSAGDSDPVVASSSSDTLESTLANPDNVFPALSSTLLRSRDQVSSEAASSTDFFVESISMNTDGAYVIGYVLDGTSDTITIAQSDATGTNAVIKDDTSFYFWFWTKTRNDPFFRYMESANLSWSPDNDTNFRSWFIFGVRTDTLPAGSANYRGRFHARSYRGDNPANSERQTITGAMRLVANFDMNELSGTIDGIRSRDSSGNTDWTTSSFTITDGRIVNGQFTATLIGTDSNPNAPFDYSLRNFSGSLLGEFYGPDADEVGGVVSAEREASGQQHGRVLYGYLGGKDVDRFTREAEAVGLTPLSGKVFGTGTKELIVMAHGLVSGGGPSDYMYSHAEALSMRNPDATVVAVLRPGYFDREGRVSPGNNFRHGGDRRVFADQYTAENNWYLAETIRNLRETLSPERVIVVGHSAGAIQFSTIIGQYEGLVDGAVLVAGTYDIGSFWPNSQSPLDFTDTFDGSVKVIAISGTEDTGVPVSVGQHFVQILKENGVDAEFGEVPGATHGYSDLTAAVRTAIDEIRLRLTSNASTAGVSRSFEHGQTELLAGNDTAVVRRNRSGTGWSLTVGEHSVALDDSDLNVHSDLPDVLFRTFNDNSETAEFWSLIGGLGASPMFEHFDIKGWQHKKVVANADLSTLEAADYTEGDYVFVVHGDRTPQSAVLATGTATYTGHMGALEFPTDAAVLDGDPAVMWYEGDTTLTADFGNAEVAGRFDNLQRRPGDASTLGAVSGEVTFNAMIDGSQFAADDVTGTGDMTGFAGGSTRGAFYGPAAEEAGGVFDAADTTNNRALIGWFGGKRP